MGAKLMNRTRWLAPLIGVMFLAGMAGTASAKEFVLGLQCDRSGPTQTIGPFMCQGYHDYIKYFNKKNSLGGGHTLRAFEIDHGYKVPRAIEAYERQKQAGALLIGLYGTPHTKALTPKLTEDKILGTSPGFGSADAANGIKYPYLYPLAASYWSQMGAAVKYVMDNWKGPGKPKIAYLFYDNPAGREPLPILEDLGKKIGFKYQTYAIPPPGVEMRPQVLDIARKYHADWVIAHIFGKGPSVSIKEFKRVRFPLNRVISFVWGFGESDMDAAGWDTAEGYQGLQFAGLGQDHAIIREIIKMYQDEGKSPPKEMKKSVYYNRGVFYAAVHAEAVRLAMKKYGTNLDGEKVKEGMESIKDFDMGGFLPPLQFSAKDHEGGGWAQVWQVQGGKFVPKTKYIRGFRDVVSKHVWGG